MNDVLVVLLANVSHSFGGSLGWAIVVLSLGIRVALLPLTVKLARRARRNQEIIQRLQPEIDRLKQRYQKKPERLFHEMRNLYRQHQCHPFDLPALLGTFVQLPIFGMLYSAIRTAIASSGPFLWIRSLASPDLLLTILIVTLAGASACLMPTGSEHMRSTFIIIQVLLTFFIVWKLAAGLALYWASSSLVGLLQAAWLRRPNEAPRTV